MTERTVPAGEWIFREGDGPLEFRQIDAAREAGRRPARELLEEHSTELPPA